MNDLFSGAFLFGIVCVWTVCAVWFGMKMQLNSMALCECDDMDCNHCCNNAKIKEYE